MTLQLCVLLWAAEGQEAALTEYEDDVLAVLPRYGGRVISRVRRSGAGDGPLEVQVIHLPDRTALTGYLEDPARLALAEVRTRVVSRTEMFEVDTLS